VIVVAMEALVSGHIALPQRLLKKLKERKAKIRKFMLYVNGMLNGKIMKKII